MLPSQTYTFIKKPPLYHSSSSLTHHSLPKPQLAITPSSHRSMPKLDLHCAATEPKLQGGRFEEGITDAIELFTDAVEPFTESFSFDKALYKHDIMGSKAHASMLPKQSLASSSISQLP
ncbi:putative argininosuccinate lyase [Rosa chinensis]|uniref:Putative argininosuccinate lyase n=1 Tax=Rosa chinensis TaxID=74649 RepID=A0A2P6PIX8_ROSCH|nr:putative argininosuccinate lyase [Rosa chinensis]